MPRGRWAEDEDNNLDTTEVLNIAMMTLAAGPLMGSARDVGAAVPLDSSSAAAGGGL